MLKRYRLLMLLVVSVLGCINMLKLKEVLEGSEAWIRELTRGMTITAQYPEGRIRLHQPYEFVITIENHGKHEPHLNTAMVKVFEGPDLPNCTMIEPAPLDIEPFSSGILFYMPPKKVARNTITTIRIQCVFTQPGAYTLFLSAEFRESGKDFISRVISLTVDAP